MTTAQHSLSSLIAGLLASVLSFFVLSSSVYAKPAYVGDSQCRKCHIEIYQDYKHSGHPYKIQKITDKAPSYPDGTSPGVPNPPQGMGWEDISYVIGGYAWKARFMDKQGYILTGPENRQYNLANSDLDKSSHWTGYDADKGDRKPYTCGSCHTTGWIETGPEGPHQDNLEGIHGTWAQTGVTCEACHGPGSDHIKSPEKILLTTDENCGECHKRGDAQQIDASNGLIKHHEQYEDLLASPHNDLACSTCHNPHQSVKYSTDNTSITNSCLGCHKKKTVKLSNSEHQNECITCHMPRIAKSAVSKMIETKAGMIPIGDIRTHIYRITTDLTWQLFTKDGKFVQLDTKGKAHITLDRSCLTCHTDKTLEWAKTNAMQVH